MITVLKMESSIIFEQELVSLFPLFRDSLLETDYMAIGEIVDIETLKKVLSNKNLIHFIAFEEELPIGYCQVIYKEHSVNFNSGAKINALSVMPNKRSGGVGSMLLEKTIQELRKNKKVKNIYLDVVKENIVAKKLYENAGFIKVGELKNMFTKDEILMDIEIYSLLT